MNIQVSDLAFEYRNRGFSLHIPDLRIESGSRVALVGPSGSGKTTLLRLLAGIHRPDSGELTLGEKALSRLGDAERRAFRITSIGFVFQDFQLIEYLNVEENIRLPFRIHPSMNWTNQTAGRLHELIDATGIAGKRKSSIAELSHGEKQRIAICRALITEPRLVLADEPTGNLDPANKHRILKILFDETQRQHATLVMVTHDRELLDGFDQVVDFQAFQSAQ